MFIITPKYDNDGNIFRSIVYFVASKRFNELRYSKQIVLIAVSSLSLGRLTSGYPLSRVIVALPIASAERFIQLPPFAASTVSSCPAAKMRLVVQESSEKVGEWAAQYVVERINRFGPTESKWVSIEIGFEKRRSTGKTVTYFCCAGISCWAFQRAARRSECIESWLSAMPKVSSHSNTWRRSTWTSTSVRVALGERPAERKRQWKRYSLDCRSAAESPAKLSPLHVAQFLPPHWHSAAERAHSGRQCIWFGGRMWAVRAWDPRCRRHWSVRRRDRNGRPHRVQRAGLVAGVADARQDARPRDDRGERALLRQRARGAAAGADGRRRDHPGRPGSDGAGHGRAEGSGPAQDRRGRRQPHVDGERAAAARQIPSRLRRGRHAGAPRQNRQIFQGENAQRSQQ